MSKQLTLFDVTAPNMMIYLNGSGRSFRCDNRVGNREVLHAACGCNVFKQIPNKETDEPGTKRYQCNACRATYISEA